MAHADKDVSGRKQAQATVYQKHSHLRISNETYRWWHLPGAGRLRGAVSSNAKLLIEAPVNGGRNYNGPKVAKFLVG